jgi:hypothetical protein
MVFGPALWLQQFSFHRKINFDISNFLNALDKNLKI